MHIRRCRLMAVAVTALALLFAGCVSVPAARGRFERTLTVDGPVQLDLRNGSGDVRITAGAPGQVRVKGEFELREWIWESGERRAEDYEKNPPIERRGESIRIGYEDRWRSNVRVDYEISAPLETSVRVTSGSGDVTVNGVRGPAWLSAGSGSITAEHIREETHATAGSGTLRLREISGLVRASAGSGNIEIMGTDGDVRASTGSGRITIERPGGRVNASTSSGGAKIIDALGDVRAKASSGSIQISGAPKGNFYWDLDASSGSIRIEVGPRTGFRLVALTSSGRISTDIPLNIEEQDRRSVRGRAGNGEGRIDVRTSSGSIRIQ